MRKLTQLKQLAKFTPEGYNSDVPEHYTKDYTEMFYILCRCQKGCMPESKYFQKHLIKGLTSKPFSC